MSKVHGIECSFSTDTDFQQLCDTYRLRNRLMHPKEPFDPGVSDVAILAAKQGVAWLNREFFGTLMHRCSEAVPKLCPPTRYPQPSYRRSRNAQA